MNQRRPGRFRAADGRNLVVTFGLASSLFLLWGFCNGTIDVMDKHFQREPGPPPATQPMARLDLEGIPG